MNLFSPNKIPVEKQIVLKLLDCKPGSNAFKIIDSIYETVLNKAYSLAQPSGLIKTGEIPGFFVLRDLRLYSLPVSILKDYCLILLPVRC